MSTVATDRAGHRKRFVSWVARHPLGGYVLLAFAISWAFFVPAAL